MHPQFDISTLPIPAQKILEPTAPPKLRESAAKGIILGLKPGDVLSIVALLAESPDPDVSSVAFQTLRTIKPQLLDGALSAPLHPGVIDSLARAHVNNDEVAGRLLLLAEITTDTIEYLAEYGNERVCERIAINEQKLLEDPRIIERLYMNLSTRMSTSDRILELAVRNGIELDIPAFKQAAQAIQNELVAAPTEEPTYDDILFKQTEEIAKRIQVDLENEDTHAVDDEGNEKVTDKCKPIWVQLEQMSVTQKIRRALLGSSTERLILVRDTNRLVSTAAIKSPLIREPEVVRIAASKNVSDDVLRVIASNREWTRSHQVKYNLVTNPRTPFTFAVQLVGHLREHELKLIAKSKNVTGAIATAARQNLARKDTGKS